MMRRNKAGLAIVGAGVVGVLACAVPEMPEHREGAAIYNENCAMCHGADGRGDGEIAVGLRPAPSDLSVLARSNGGSFPVDRVLSQVDGYLKGDSPSDDMPEFGALLEGDLVPVETDDGVMTPTPRPLAALLAYLETIQR